ncbi:substrate-binding domain-containing protein [Pseudomonas karstica]|uniref:substrate-binding domain-containing protein n=1 Tax=Pseudomonas karstica TaxID=1055468 RepID=UPI0031B5FA23
MAGESNQPEGQLRISSADWFASYVPGPVLSELIRRHPLIVPEVIAGHRLFDLARRETDIALRIVPFTEPDIVRRRLVTLSYGLYVNNQSPFLPRTDGEGVDLITMNTSQAHYPDALWLKTLYLRARAVLTSSSRTAQAQMCALELGGAVLPRVLGDQLPALKLLDTGEPPPERDIWMGYHNDMRQKDRLRALADLADEMIGTA